MPHPIWSRHAARFALIAALALPAVAPAQGIPPHVPVSTTLGDLARVRASYVDAFNAHDAAAVSKLYAPDAIVLGADGSETVGASAIAKANADSAATWPQASAHSNSVKVYGSTAIDVGTWTVHLANGGEQVSHYLAVLRHGVSGWKLQHVAIVPAAR